MSQRIKASPGFTIVELLIVVVVIAILAAITIVSYNGIQQRARESALKSDLRQAKTHIESYKISSNDTYPASTTGIPKSSDTTYEYIANATGYCLTARMNSVGPFYIDEKGGIQNGPCPGHEYGYPAPAGVNIAPSFQFWAITGAATTSANGEAWLSTPGPPHPRLRMPRIRVDGAISATVSYEMRPLLPNVRFQWNSYYYAADGVTTVANTLGYPSNGHAPVFQPENVWTPLSTNFTLGPNIVYLVLDASTNLTYTGPVELRNVKVTLIR